MFSFLLQVLFSLRVSSLLFSFLAYFLLFVSFSSHLSHSFPLHASFFFPRHSLSFQTSFHTRFLSYFFKNLHSIFLLFLSLSCLPLLFSFPGSLTPWALWYCCHGDAHHFLAWMEDTLLMRLHGREKKSDGEKDKDTQSGEKKPWQGKSEWYGNDRPCRLRYKTFPPCHISTTDELKRILQDKAGRILLRGLG